MVDDFGYINARVRGMKAKLLGPEFYSEALATSDFGAFASVLAQSPYARDVEEAQARHSGLRAVDEALGRNFHREARKIRGFADGDPGRLIRFLLMRYDLQNLKAIARARHAGRDAEDIRQALVPAGELRPGVLDNLAEQSELAGVAQALAITRHPLAPAFARAARAYQSEGDLYKLEIALDRAYFRVLFTELEETEHPEGLMQYLRLEIDATNLRTALKIRGADAGAATTGELFIPGGREISRQTFETLLSDDTPAAFQSLSGTSFAEIGEAGSLGDAERVIAALLARSARKLYLSDPLDIGVVLYYLNHKEAETARLRLLARGKFYGVPNDALERELGHA
ncbi:MAG: V-type ATPase subunit [Deinococcota bacterium]|jgi:V/A-type H+-transporting ATPase subunit C|nr:V-type ATPase subunit [Deinococcota bacterium]